MQILQLRDIADIQIGLVLSRKETNESTGIKYKKLSLKAINENGIISQKELEEFNSIEVLNGNVLTKKNDIVTKLFTPLNPCLISNEYENLLIPAQLAVIRLKTDKVLPEYLRAYLSQDRINKKLTIEETGGLLRSLRIGSIATIAIPILPIKKQEIISEIYMLQIKRAELQNMLLGEQKIYDRFILEKLTNLEVI